MKNKKVIITGINGFLGINFLRFLQESEPSAKIFGLGRNLAGQKKDNISAIECDITNENHTKSIISEIKPDYIFHFAGIGNNNDWKKLFDSNVNTTISLLESIKNIESSKPRTIIIGSAAEFGQIFPNLLPISEETPSNPISRYGVSMSWRAIVTRYYANIGLDVIYARIFNITGPGVSNLSPAGSFAEQIVQIEYHNKEPVIYCGNLEPKRDFIDIKDVMNAIYLLALKGKSKETYNICSGKSIPIIDILNLLLQNSKFNIKITIDPSRVRQIDVLEVYGTHNKISIDTKWEPRISIEESLKETLNYYRNTHLLKT